MFFGTSTRAESAETLEGQPATAKAREGAGKSDDLLRERHGNAEHHRQRRSTVPDASKAT